MADRDDRGGPPERISDSLSRFLRESGVGERVKQTEVLEQWEALVGPRIAAVTKPVSIREDGTLLATASNSAWMHELTLLEAELLAALNRVTGSRPLRRIRWTLMG